MAAHMAAIFVLLLLLPVPSSSFHLTFKLNGHVYPGGCGYDQSGEEQEQPVDGILGLGRGSPVSLISQLMKENIITKDVIAHCISADGGGFLHIGDYEHSSADGVQLNLKGTMIRNNMNVVFDSGSAFTFFDSQTYQATNDAVTGSLGNSLTPVADTEFELCWKGSNKFKSVGEVKSFFKPIFLIFRFGKKKATFDIPPENYLFIVSTS
ncbi:hypothetical protein EJB05_44420, partial [Eragrostis curvula]